jgi:hypothetical protein
MVRPLDRTCHVSPSVAEGNARRDRAIVGGRERPGVLTRRVALDRKCASVWQRSDCINWNRWPPSLGAPTCIGAPYIIREADLELPAVKRAIKNGRAVSPALLQIPRRLYVGALRRGQCPAFDIGLAAGGRSVASALGVFSRIEGGDLRLPFALPFWPENQRMTRETLRPSSRSMFSASSALPQGLRHNLTTPTGRDPCCGSRRPLSGRPRPSSWPSRLLAAAVEAGILQGLVVRVTRTEGTVSSA